MARRHGRNGAVYLAVTSGAAASPVAFQASWTLSITTDKTDVTTLADSQKVYAAGIPDLAGEFSGFSDDQSSQAYIAAADGLPRAFYLYPDAVNSPSVYFAGTVVADFTAAGSASGAVSVASAWNAAGTVQRFPAGAGLPGVLDETAAAEVTDEGGGIILNEDGS